MRTLLLLLILTPLVTVAQERRYSTFYEQRNSLFETLPITSEDIVFLGNSITNGAEWHELLNNPHLKNRGISSDITLSVYDRLNNIVTGKPSKIFLLIGINDIAKGFANDTIVKNMESIVKKITEESPKTKLYLQSILPVNSDFNMFQGHMKPDSIKSINKSIQVMADKYSATYIDLYSKFTTPETDKLNPLYTNDGLHLLGAGYQLWKDILIPYIKE